MTSTSIILARPDGCAVDMSACWSNPRPIKVWASSFGVAERTFYRRLGSIETRREFGGLCLRLADCPPSIIAADLGLEFNGCQTPPPGRKSYISGRRVPYIG